MANNQDSLDADLERLFLEDIDDAFVEWCKATVPQYPVVPALGPDAGRYLEMMDNAMIVFSGHGADEYRKMAEATRVMKRQELQKGRWMAMPKDETAAARVIAGRAFEDISKTGAVVDDPEKLYLALGLYVYMAILCSPWYDAGAFRHLFVLGWLIYYSEILSAPAGRKNSPYSLIIS